MDKKDRFLFFYLLYLAVVLIYGLGSAQLFDWDEINFAESAREMLITGNYRTVMVDFKPFWEKPPLFFWLQAFSMRIFGIGEFAARFPNVLAGILTILFAYVGAKRFVNAEIAKWWVLIYCASITPFFYFKTGIIDPWFNLFIFGSILALVESRNRMKSNRFMFFLAGLLLGFAFITKGPVAILLVGLTGFFVWSFDKFKRWFNILDLILIILGIVIPIFLWLGPEIADHGWWFLKEFIGYQIDLFLNPVASHGQPWFYHPVVLLLLAFPAGVIALPILIRRDGSETAFEQWMRITFWVVLIVFSIATTKIIHYSSMCFLPLSYLAAVQIQKSLNRISFILFGIIAFIWSIALIALPVLFINRNLIVASALKIKDEVAKLSLITPSGWNYMDLIPGVLFAIAIWSLASLWRKMELDRLKWVLISMPLIYTYIMIRIVPNVEMHIQGDLIRFYESVSHEKPWIQPFGYKTYAHWFYGQKPIPDPDNEIYQFQQKWLENRDKDYPDENADQRSRALQSDTGNYLLNSAATQKVYFVCLPSGRKELDKLPQLEFIGDFGAYRVYELSPYTIVY
jgi:4-amino-4-deoxy-L-arabinose transferase-like glycosyltransferase